ncbi:MAG: toll/interleukin-1 receptor domain-containing protein, partial [Rhizobiales bacterium]|nr:toll/interleukin-1 receptor domain-containing protein [Rhizobacter sp.]
MSAAPARAAPVTLFYSYAQEDEALRDELQGHLKLLERRGLLAPWHDRKIVPGADWAAEIDAELARAELVLLLVSKDFIASDYIIGVELAVAMRRHGEAAASVVPIIVRAVDLDFAADAEALPFLKLQGLPTDLRPVTSWPNRDEAWTDVAKGLRKAVEAIRARRPVMALPPPLARAPFEPKPTALPMPRSSPRGESFGDAPSRPSHGEYSRASLDAMFSRSSPPRDAPPDALLDRVVRDVTTRIAAAQQSRGGTPFDAMEVALLQRETRALVDAPDQKR